MWSSCDSIFLYRRQSSANKRTCDDTAKGKSFIWHKKSRGPKTVPWGTPESTVTLLDDSPSTTTCIYLLVRNVPSQWWIDPVIPKLSNLVSNSSFGTVSKAFEKSRMIYSVLRDAITEDDDEMMMITSVCEPSSLLV